MMTESPGNIYGDTTASGQARLQLGDVRNNYSYHYNIRRRKSDETLREDQRSQVLLNAAAEGQTPRVRHLLHLGADFDHRDELGLTALHHACLSGFDDTAKTLLDAGADVNATSLDCGTPLHLAVLKARKSVVQLLLQARAGVNKPSRLLGTSLHCAYYASDGEIIDLLKKKHASESITAVVLPSLMKSIASEGDLAPQASKFWSSGKWNTHSPAPGHFVLFCLPSHLALANARRACLEPLSLLQKELHGAQMSDINEGSLEGLCAPHNVLDATLLAILFGQSMFLSELLQSMGKERPFKNEKIALQTASRLGHSQCLRVFLDHTGIEKVSWHEVEESIDLAISSAELTGDPACLEMLLSCCPDPDDHVKETIILDAISYDRKNSLDCLLDDWQLPTASRVHHKLTACAARLASNTILARLVHHGLDINALSTGHNQQWTALVEVVHQSNAAAVRNLLGLGALPDIQDQSGDTALHLAVRIGDVGIVSLLIDHGASLDLQDNDGSTALLAAVRRGLDDIVSLLVHESARISLSNDDTSLDLQDREGNTALLAAICNHLNRTFSDSTGTSNHDAWSISKTAGCLLHYGASAKIRNNSGMDALEACLNLKSLSERKSCVRVIFHYGFNRLPETPLQRYFALRTDIWAGDQWGHIDREQLDLARSQLPQHIREKVVEMERDEEHERMIAYSYQRGPPKIPKSRTLFTKFKKKGV